jgi:hypothetical protein
MLVRTRAVQEGDQRRFWCDSGAESPCSRGRPSTWLRALSKAASASRRNGERSSALYRSMTLERPQLARNSQTTTSRGDGGSSRA